jgi:hypothetical protein
LKLSRGAGSDTTVNDATGLAQADSNRVATMRDTLRQTKTQTYEEYIIKKMSDAANADTLIQFVQENADFSEMSTETALKKLKEFAQRQTDGERFFNIEAPPQILRFMQENGIAVTADMLDATKKYLSDKKSFSKSMNQLRAVLDKKGIDADFSGYLPSSDRLADSLNGTAGFDDGFMEKLEEIVAETEDFEVVEQIDLVRKTAEILEFRRMKAGGHNMPMLLNGNVTAIDLYVINPRLSEADQTDIFMSLDAGVLGEVQMILKTENDCVNLMVTAESDAAMHHLKENEPMLKRLLAEAGYMLSEIKYKPAKTNGSTTIEFPAARQGGRIYESV